MSPRIPLTLFATLAALAGCAGTPTTIRHAPDTDVSLAQVRATPVQFTGATVRWGGSVVSVRNLRDESVIEIVARRLERGGRPLDEDRSDGRFLATVKGFVDPAIHVAGREVTVYGTVTGTVEQAIDEHRYTYVQVAAETLYLWPPRLPSEFYYYDPFWDPWYPWGWPYHRPYYYRPYYR